jgi:hypothetical protein
LQETIENERIPKAITKKRRHIIINFLVGNRKYKASSKENILPHNFTLNVPIRQLKIQKSLKKRLTPSKT